MKTLIFCGILFLAFACSKDENNDNKTKTELLTSAQWKYESGGFDIDKNGVIDITFEQSGVVPACALDNTGLFRVNGSGTNYEGATKCNASDPDSTNFNWAFASNETQLLITGSAFAGIGGNFKIVELSTTRLKVSKDSSAQGFNGAAVINFKH